MEKLCVLNQAVLEQGNFKEIGKSILLGGPIMGPIIIDPGSLASDYPAKYGYKMAFKNLEEYIEAFSRPSWHQWINYEAELLHRDDLIKLIFKFVEFSIAQRERYGFYDRSRAEIERFHSKVNRIAMDEVDAIMKLPESEAREVKLRALRDAVDSSIDSLYIS
jgi:hypothetical protein